MGGPVTADTTATGLPVTMHWLSIADSSLQLYTNIHWTLVNHILGGPVTADTTATGLLVTMHWLSIADSGSSTVHQHTLASIVWTLVNQILHNDKDHQQHILCGPVHEYNKSKVADSRYIENI